MKSRFYKNSQAPALPSPSPPPPFPPTAKQPGSPPDLYFPLAASHDAAPPNSKVQRRQPGDFSTRRLSIAKSPLSSPLAILPIPPPFRPFFLLLLCPIFAAATPAAKQRTAFFAHGPGQNNTGLEKKDPPQGHCITPAANAIPRKNPGRSRKAKLHWHIRPPILCAPKSPVTLAPLP